MPTPIKDATVANILENPDPWLGGELINYGMVDPHWPSTLRAAMVAEPDYPRRARVTTIQLEDGRYFAVIGTALDGLENFACMEEIGVLAVNERPLFPAEQPGEIVFRGRKDPTGTCWHEWHLIPKR